MCAPFLQLELLTHYYPGSDLENISSQNMHVMFCSLFLFMSGVDFCNCFFDFDPHFPKSCLFKSLGCFGSKVGLLLAFSSLKYGLDVGIAVLLWFGLFSSLKCLLRSPQTELRMSLDKPLVTIFAGHCIFKRLKNVSPCRFESQVL
jgi:hypothetical protein